MERFITTGGAVEDAHPVPNFENIFSSFLSKLTDANSKVSELKRKEQVYLVEKGTLLETISEKEALCIRMEEIILSLQANEKIWVREKDELTIQLMNVVEELEGWRSEAGNFKGMVSSLEDELLKERQKSRHLEKKGMMLQLVKAGLQATSRKMKDSADIWQKRMETLEMLMEEEEDGGRGPSAGNIGKSRGTNCNVAEIPRDSTNRRGDAGYKRTPASTHNKLAGVTETAAGNENEFCGTYEVDDYGLGESEESDFVNGDGYISDLNQAHCDSLNGDEARSDGSSFQTRAIGKKKGLMTTSPSNYEDIDLGNIPTSTGLAKKSRIEIEPHLLLVSSLESHVVKANPTESGYHLLWDAGQNVIDSDDSSVEGFPGLNIFIDERNVPDDGDNLQDELYSNQKDTQDSSPTADCIPEWDANHVSHGVRYESTSNSNCTDDLSDGFSNGQSNDPLAAQPSSSTNNAYAAAANHVSRSREKKRCAVIGCKKLISNANYTTHMNVHSISKQFTCPICDKSFASKQYLKSHKKSHEFGGSLECRFCHKYFKHKSNLNRHSKICKSRKM